MHRSVRHDLPGRRTALLIWAASLAMAITLHLPRPTEACPACKLAVPTEDAAASQPRDITVESLSASMGRGYNYSIMFMMASPFVIASLLGALLYLAIRKPAMLGLAPPSSRPNAQSTTAEGASRKL